ncbi:MAG: hypothetical protein ACSHX6_16735 [Akkermansiaceae bacterium]
MEIIISIIAGLLGGGGIGEALKKLSLGKMGNLLTGGLGGLLGGLANTPGLGDLLGNLTGDPQGDAAVAGAAGGGVLMTIIGFIKNMILKK